MGAPISTTYDADTRQRMIDHVFVQVACGRAVTTILQDDDGMPSSGTFWTWVSRNPDLQSELARARELGIEARLTKAQHIADLGEVVPLDGLSGVALERAMLARDPKVMKLRIDAEIKFAQMLKPKTYGPKLDLTTDGQALNKPAPDAADRAEAMLRDVATRTRIAPRDIVIDAKAKELLS